MDLKKRTRTDSTYDWREDGGQVSFPIVPWPVHDMPQKQDGLSARVWHEVLGLVGYWAFGRSSDLYPAQ